MSRPNLPRMVQSNDLLQFDIILALRGEIVKRFGEFWCVVCAFRMENGDRAGRKHEAHKPMA